MRTGLFSRRTIRQGAVSAIGSARIKLLLACCIAFTLIALAGRTRTFMGWNQYAASPSPSSLPGKGYTLLINTWKRYDLLKQSISHYVSCPGLDSVHIVWSEPDPPSESLVIFLNRVVNSKSRDGREIELKFDINKEDSLNNRFKEIKDLKSDVVFSIDDDIIFPCPTVELAFSVWRSAPDTMVGFVPRVHWVDKSEGNEEKYTYSGWWSVWWTGTYSIILSKAAFFHKKYLSMYTYEMPSSIREYVTKNRNCEDIAMSFLVANATGAPPIWVKGNIFEIGSTGISSLGGHTERRTECVNRFVTEYGRMPLVSTSVKAVDSRFCWFW
ncbi:glycosyltransferase family 64 protein c4 [Phtheirospermum japonicum]|uniref:Glycosyltransferase family 64 protein c4 n=1 Tax=Phtheirospermum japonicum TaxID=374723 RepID=A0A830D2V7_9LAMI|nr:glycosyltransferase family 64 protein c4 [Phtheirospermum japonicum]